MRPGMILWMTLVWGWAGVAVAQPPMMPPGGMGDGIWYRDAYYGERETFDSCFGHQPGNGQYHHHVQPVCLRAQLNDNLELVNRGRIGDSYRERGADLTHSPILGWSFDGYPIYGPYGYADPKDGSSPVQRMQSSFRLREITDRTTLPDWALAFHANVSKQLTRAQQGPPISDKFPLGRYIEDYEYVAQSGDLDVYNGRFAITPEFPQGTYAYYVTIDQEGKPAFPYVIGAQYYGALNGGVARTVPTDAQDYFTSGRPAPAAGSDALLASWMTSRSTEPAQAISGFDPSEGPKTTWPSNVPAGARVAGGVSQPANADVQRIRTTATAVYINSNNLASYVMGPWFISGGNGGVFMNFASVQNFQAQLPRAAQPAAGAKAATSLGPVGMWVNGVAVFNALDGASYRNAGGDDAGGGIVASNALMVSAASLEGGPSAAGSLVAALATFDVRFSEPVTVTVRDAAGVSQAAEVLAVEASRVEFRVPETAAFGLATVAIAAGGRTIPGALHIVESYPSLYKVEDSVRFAETCETVRFAIDATGFSRSTDVSATIAGEPIAVAITPQQDRPGRQRADISIPCTMAGKGQVEIVITQAGKRSNAVSLWIE